MILKSKKLLKLYINRKKNMTKKYLLLLPVVFLMPKM